jgi:FtsP/CotA-like multicopper oxidase with cupredoxin domain
LVSHEAPPRPETSKGDGMTVRTNEFPRETSGLPAASATSIVELSGGDRFALRIAPVTKRIGDATVRMLAYNGSIPGPTLRVAQGSEVLVDVENEGDMEATVHWHGLRLENRCHIAEHHESGMMFSFDVTA